MLNHSYRSYAIAHVQFYYYYIIMIYISIVGSSLICYAIIIMWSNSLLVKLQCWWYRVSMLYCILTFASSATSHFTWESSFICCFSIFILSFSDIIIWSLFCCIVVISNSLFVASFLPRLHFLDFLPWSYVGKFEIVPVTSFQLFLNDVSASW